jgi:hypothetical protein
MVFAGCLIISQCVGSISADKKNEQEKWEKSMNGLVEVKE